MREALAARFDRDFVAVSHVEHRRSWLGAALRPARIVLTHPREVLAGLILLAASTAITVNALGLQRGPHPAPLFSPMRVAPPVQAPIPPARPVQSQAQLQAQPQPAPAPAPRRGQRSSAGTTGARRPRRARLRLTHVDPWSVLKTSLLLSIALGIVTVVAVSVVWAVLNASGLWGSINETVGQVVGTQASADFRIQDYVGTERVLGFTMLVAAVDVVLVTVVSTLGAFLYNLAAALLGGLEVVLAEDDF